MTVPNPSCIQLPDSSHEAANTLPTRGLTIVASIPSNTEWNIWFDSNSWGSLELTRSSAVTWNQTRIFAWWSINRTISTLWVRIGIPIFSNAIGCPRCTGSLDIFGDHAEICGGNNSIREAVGDAAVYGHLNPSVMTRDRRHQISPTSWKHWCCLFVCSFKTTFSTTDVDRQSLSYLLELKFFCRKINLLSI